MIQATHSVYLPLDGLGWVGSEFFGFYLIVVDSFLLIVLRFFVGSCDRFYTWSGGQEGCKEGGGLEMGLGK